MECNDNTSSRHDDDTEGVRSYYVTGPHQGGITGKVRHRDATASKNYKVFDLGYWKLYKEYLSVLVEWMRGGGR